MCYRWPNWTTQQCTVQYSTLDYTTIQYSKYSTARTIQYSTVHYSNVHCTVELLSVPPYLVRKCQTEADTELQDFIKDCIIVPGILTWKYLIVSLFHIFIRTYVQLAYNYITPIS